MKKKKLMLTIESNPKWFRVGKNKYMHVNDARTIEVLPTVVQHKYKGRGGTWCDLPSMTYQKAAELMKL